MAEIFQVLNHTPFKAIDYNFPEEKMREKLSRRRAIDLLMGCHLRSSVTKMDMINAS